MLIALGTLSATYWLSQLLAESVWNISLVPDYLKQGGPQRYMELSLIPHGCFFAIGGLSWNVMCNERSRWLWLPISYSTLGALAEIHYTNITKQAWVGVSSDAGLAQMLWLACIVFLWVTVSKRKLFEKFISTPMTRILGKMTYPLYLLHTTIGCAVLFDLAQMGVNRWIALLASVSVSLAASHVVACTIEPRIKDILANILDRKKLTNFAL
jgi:peptidoglycan/LPS O-acetylase OafA/YrhL